MTDKKQLLRLLYENKITAILIGGIALRLYNSPRVTHDIDLAVRTLDADQITDLMYENDYYLVIALENDSARIKLSKTEAKKWIETMKIGSITFIGIEKKPLIELVPLKKIDITTQVDYLFELSIPVMRLKEKAKEIKIDDFTVLVASLDDLLILKKNRKDKTGADHADIKFIEDMMKID